MSTDEEKVKQFFSEFRVSRRLTPVRLTLLMLGLAFSLGFIALYLEIGQRTPKTPIFSYLLAGVMVSFTVATILDLVAGAPEPHGLYRLALRGHADRLSFLEGWALIAGSLTAIAFLGRTFAHYALWLTDMSLPDWLMPVTAVGVILLMALPNALGKGNRHLETLLIVIPLLLYWACLIISRVTGATVPMPVPAPAGQMNIWVSAALALAGFWALQAGLVHSEELHQHHTNLPRATAASAVLIPVLLAAAALVVPTSVSTTASWPFWEQWGQQITAGTAAVLLAGGVWWLFGALGKQGAVMARHGFLPHALGELHPVLHTPLAFQAVTAGAAILLAGLANFEQIAPVVGFAWGAVAVGLNAASMLAYYGQDPDERRSRLPFFPLVPGLGIAGMLFLMAFLPLRAWLAGILWLAAGFGLYAWLGVRWRAQRYQGITIFKEEEAVKRPRSEFRVLVPVANPNTAQHLMALAAALAKPQNGSIIALQVIEAPAQVSMAAGRRMARGHLGALKAATADVEAVGVPVLAMTRVARTAQDGILDTAVEESCNLIVLGWTQRSGGVTGALGRIIGSVLDRAPCDVLVINGDFPDTLGNILIPAAGGPHAMKALALADRLAQFTGARITVLNVVRAEAVEGEEAAAHKQADDWVRPLKSAASAEIHIIRSSDVVGTIVREAENADLIMMGTSAESWLDRVLFGAIPEQVAQRAKPPLVLTKAYLGLARLWGQRLWQGLFNLFPTLEGQETLDLYRNLRQGARGSVNYYTLIVLSAIIASVGLLSNSAAIIIGAMLVAPFMSPTLALSLGIVLGEPRMLSQGVEATIKGVGAAVVLAAFTALIFPISGLTAEIVSRTHPTLLDLVVALASGAAGAYAMGRKELAAALPGVAIAAALMPPVCTVGIGVARGQGAVIGGALLLFVTNVIAIILAGALIFLLLGIRPRSEAKERQQRLRRGLSVSIILVVIIALLLGVITYEASRATSQQALIEKVLSAQLQNIEQAALVSVDSAQSRAGAWQIDATVEAPARPSEQQVTALSTALADALDQPVQLRLRVILTVEVNTSSAP